MKAYENSKNLSTQPSWNNRLNARFPTILQVVPPPEVDREKQIIMRKCTTMTSYTTFRWLYLTLLSKAIPKSLAWLRKVTTKSKKIDKHGMEVVE